MFPKCFQVESLNQLEKIYIYGKVSLNNYSQGALEHLIPNCSSEATEQTGVARCEYVETVTKGISEKKSRSAQSAFPG